MVKYKCDAWGNHSACNPDGRVNNSETFIGNINPFRYKGYYYDTDTDMYYCKSRYYVPELGRFISSDSIEYLDPSNINGMNLYAYCYNDPVNNVDSSGCFAISAIIIGAVIGTIAGLISQVVSDFCSNFLSHGLDFSSWEMSSWQTYVGTAIGEAIGGGAGIVIATVVSFVGGSIGNVVSQYVSYGEIQPLPAFIQGGYSAIVNGFMSAVFSKAALTIAPSWIERFCDIAGLSAFGVSVGSYFAYYSLNANKLRKKKIKKMIGER